MATLSSPTIEDLIQNVRNMLNQPNATNSFWSDEELTVYLNEGVRRYFAEVVQHAEGQFTALSERDIVDSVQTVTLPSDCFKLKQVWRKVTGGYEPMHYRNNIMEGVSTEGAGGGSSFRPDYYLRGNTIVLSQMPGFSETGGIRIEYVQFPETMITGGDSLTAQVSPVFKDMIEAYAIYKAKVKESLVNGTNTSAMALQNLNDLFTSFKELIPNRSASPSAIKPFNPEEY
jgi:hypothetical protein